MGLGNLFSKAIDSVYEVVSPESYVKRQLARQQATKFGYKNANSRRLGPQGMTGQGSGNNHLTSGQAKVLRERAREMDRNNLFVASIMDRITEAVLGTGLNIQINSGNKRWDDKAEKNFNDFWNKRPEVRGIFEGQEVERLVMRSLEIDGDILIVLTKDGLVQVIEADRIRTPNEHEKNPNIYQGVEVDSVGKPIRFYVMPYEDGVGMVRKDNNYNTFDARYCIFLAKRKRISQTRGVTSLAPCMDLFEDIDAFMEASIIQQKISAAHVMAIEQKGGASVLDGATTEATDSLGNTYQEENFRPGQILYLDIGESAKILGPSQTGQQFGPFITQLIRFAGLCFGLPLEVVSLDFSKTNYSSARAAILVSHKAMAQKHKSFVRQFMEPIVRWKTENDIRKGILNAPTKGYTISATPPKMISVDPLKETKADREKINGGLSTLRDIVSSNGQDWTEMMKQREYEIIEASKVAKNLVKQTGEDWSARDILGIAKDFNADIFTEEPDQTPNEQTPNQE